jgi:hypothetical protein
MIYAEKEQKGGKETFGERGIKAKIKVKIKVKVRKMTRKDVAEKIGVGERQLQRYLKLASQHLNVFSGFMDSETGKLTGMPIETDEQIERLKLVRSLVVKYRNFRGKAKMIQLELEKYNQGDSNV